MEENRIELAEESKEAIVPEENLAEQPFATQEASEPAHPGDPFEELFVEDTPAFGTPQETVESVETGIDGVVTAKQDPNQHQYWQSQYDKVKGEYDNLESKYQEIESLEPIAKYIQHNPGVLDNVTQSLSNGQQAKQAPQGPPPEPLKRPERPTKPAEYDAVDAYSDPSSASYKYKEAVEGYRDGMIDFQEKRNALMENAFRQEAVKQQYMMKQRQAAQQQAMQAGNVRAQLTQGYNFSENDANGFIKEMAAPESISMDNLVALWKMKQSPSGEVLANQRKAEEMQRQKAKLNIPSTVGVAPAEVPTQASVEDRVMDALIDDFKSNNPF